MQYAEVVQIPTQLSCITRTLRSCICKASRDELWHKQTIYPFARSLVCATLGDRSTNVVDAQRLGFGS
jgi:hypothetical protein